MFAHAADWSTQKLANSAWVMILEKGYAKLNGNYANIGYYHNNYLFLSC